MKMKILWYLKINGEIIKKIHFKQLGYAFSSSTVNQFISHNIEWTLTSLGSVNPVEIR